MPWCYPVHIGDGPLAKGNRAGRGVGIGTTAPSQVLEVNGNVKFGCPSGMTSYGRGCISPVQTGTTAYLDESNCKTTYGGTICMYNEIMRACAAGVITSYNSAAATNWMGDRQGGDDFLRLPTPPHHAKKTTTPAQQPKPPATILTAVVCD